jgi:hypothetical protein
MKSHEACTVFGRQPKGRLYDGKSRTGSQQGGKLSISSIATPYFPQALPT